jgi:hypothetical protein
VSSRFVWHSLTNEVTSWAKSCLHCQWSKIHCHTRLLPQPIPIPSGGLLISTLTWWALTIQKWLQPHFMIIDRTSKWMEAAPFLKHLSAACAIALVFSWITCFGVPETIALIMGCNLHQIFGPSFAICYA